MSRRKKKRKNKKPGYTLPNCFFSRAERNGGGGGGGGCDSLLFVPCQKVCDIRTLQDVVRLLYNNPFHLLMSIGILII